MERIITKIRGFFTLRLEYYFDFLSPYSYLSWTWLRGQLDQLEERGINTQLYPVPLASVIKSYDTKGPAEIDSKRNYLFKDCLRFSKLHQIPFRTPAHLPFNSLYALRCSLANVAKEQQVSVVDAIFRGGWESGLDIGEPEVLTELLDSVGLSGENLLAQTGEKHARKELKQNLARALEHQVFGLPTFLVFKGEESPELFWGNDSIPYLKLYLENKDPLEREIYNRFEAEYPL